LVPESADSANPKNSRPNNPNKRYVEEADAGKKSRRMFFIGVHVEK
jgi:hypothetical protein